MRETLDQFSSDPFLPGEDADQSFEEVCRNIGNITTDTIIVDYGCAYGNFGVDGLPKYFPDEQLKLIEYIGVDIDKEKLRIARDIPKFDELKRRMKSDPLFIEVQDYFQQHDSTVDVVVCSKTLHDIKSKDLSDVFFHNLRILKKGGKFIFYDKGLIRQNEETNAVTWDLEDFQMLFMGTSIEVKFWLKYPKKKDRKEIHVVLVKNEEQIPDLNYFNSKLDKVHDAKIKRYDKLLCNFEEKEEKIGLSAREIEQRNFCRTQYANVKRQIEKSKEVDPQDSLSFSSIKIESYAPSNPAFVGRLVELQEIQQLMASMPVVLLWGIPGVGKTYVASELAKIPKIQDFKICWITCITSITIQDFSFAINLFLEENGRLYYF